MAFPVVHEVTTTLIETAATSHPIQLPSTVNTNDLLIAGLYEGGTDSAITTPSGWTVINNQSNASDRRMALYAKKAAGNEDGTTVDFVTASSSTMVAHVYRIQQGTWRDSGTIANDVESSYLSVDQSPNGSTPDPPSLNPTNWATEQTMWMVFCGRRNTHSVTNYPSGYQGGTQTKTAVLGANIASCRKENEIDVEDPGPFLYTGSVSNMVFTVGIRPGVAASPRRGVVYQTYVQVPAAPPEIPVDPRRAVIYNSRFEMPDAARRGIIYNSRFEIPDAPPGDYPTVASVTHTQNSANQESYTMTMPATTANGDLLIALVTGAGAQAASSQAAITGWTFIRAQENNTNYGGYLLVKKADGTEGGTTPTVDFGVGSGCLGFASSVVRINAGTWIDSGTITQDVEATSVNNNTGNIDPPSFNPTNWDVEKTLWIAGATAGLFGANITAGPANYTGFSINTNIVNAGVSAVAFRELEAASEDPGTFTEDAGAGNIGCWTIAVRPAAGGGGGSEEPSTNVWMTSGVSSWLLGVD